MTLRHDLLGVPTATSFREWTDRDTLLYALAVGAGASDPTQELQYTTENTAGLQQRVIPTFGCVIAGSRSPRLLGDFDPARLVHAEQEVVFHAPLAPAGTAHAVSTLTQIFDKEKSALLVQENSAVDPQSGQPLITTKSTFMVFGEGGFGGDRGPATPQWVVPERAPDGVVRYSTRPDQTLLYRLTGDRNPLHSDPSVALRAGFSRPIMHGMGTYGFTCRALIATVAGSDPDALASMRARFSKPALPGDDLLVHIWENNDTVLFRVLNPQGEAILDRGVATLRAS